MVRLRRTVHPLDELPVTVEVRPHDHAVLAYGPVRGLARGLETFLERTLSTGALAVFVHAFPEELEARRAMEQAAPPGIHLGPKGPLLLEAFDAAVHDLVNDPGPGEADAWFEALGEEARGRGRRGARVFLDVGPLPEDAEARASWLAFEASLGRRLDAEAGLVCAYPEAALEAPGVAESVAEAHGARYRAVPWRQRARWKR